MALAFQRAFRCSRAFRRWFPAAGGPAFCQITLGLTFCSFFAAFWRRQLYSRPPRFRETDSDRLFWRAGPMLASPNVFHFFAHKLACLSAGRFAFAFIFARSFDCFFFWHNKMVSPLDASLDVN
jgi:hypothetical protein